MLRVAVREDVERVQNLGGILGEPFAEVEISPRYTVEIF